MFAVSVLLMENSIEKPPKFVRKCSISNIIDLPSEEKQPRRRSSVPVVVPKKPFILGTGIISLIIILCITSIVAIWVFFFLPGILHAFPNLIPVLNKTTNEELLESINLSSIIVSCPDQYVYSEVSTKCQPACGKWSNCGYVCLYLKHALLAVTALVGVLVSTYAVFSWIRFRHTWKFLHYPILFCICVNLLLSISFCISDIPGIFVFYCHTKTIALDDLNQDAGIHIQIQGTLLHYLGLSNRLWFLMALIHILLMVSFPMKNIFAERKARFITLFVENSICFGLPVVLEVIPYAFGIRYFFFDEIDMPTLDNVIANSLVGFTPHVIITCLTMTLVICILYKTRIQALKMKEFGEGYQLQTIEKRLLVFSTLYFIISSIIVVSILVHNFIDTDINKAFEDYLAFITLESPYVNLSSTSTNETLRLLKEFLSPPDQGLIEEVTAPFLFFIRGMGNRLMFIAVFVVVNVRCSCRRKQPRKGSIGKDSGLTIRNSKAQL